MAKTHLEETDGAQKTRGRRRLYQMAMPSPQSHGCGRANIGHLAMLGAWREGLILFLNWFNLFD